MEFSVLFNNICQGLIFLGKGAHGNIDIDGLDISKHVDCLKHLNIDIGGFAEILVDTPNGDSAMANILADTFSCREIKTYTNGPCWDDVDALKGKFYGLTTISKYPISSYEEIVIEGPDFLKHSEINLKKTHDDGSVPHRKAIMKMTMDLPNGEKLVVINLHSIPFHRFKGVTLNDPRLDDWKKYFERLIEFNPHHHTIIMGDFNCPGISIEDFLPDIFATTHVLNPINMFEESFDIRFSDRQKSNKGDPRYYTENRSKERLRQMDYILHSPSLACIEKQVIITPSDHPALFAKFKI